MIRILSLIVAVATLSLASCASTKKSCCATSSKAKKSCCDSSSKKESKACCAMPSADKAKKK